MKSQPEVIRSRQNPRVQALARLRERGGREATGRFIIEGTRELERAMEAGVKPEAVYFCPKLFKRPEGAQAVMSAAEKIGAEIVELGEEAFDKAGYREGADGLIGVAKTWKPTLDGLQEPKDAPMYLVVVAVEKPGNLGALLRTADAAGCAAVIVCDPVTDLFNPNVVRSSQGAAFSMPVAVADRESVEKWLRARKVSILATTPAGKAMHWTPDYTGPSALLLGSEKDGLSEFWLKKADRLIGIPQLGRADSLNVGMAAAICLFEAVRQRAVKDRTKRAVLNLAAENTDPAKQPFREFRRLRG